MVTSDAISNLLASVPEPLTVAEITFRLGEQEVRECDALLWQNPDRFVWQPGHRWAVANTKSRTSNKESGGTTDLPSNTLSVKLSRDLRAITLSSGLDIVVNRRPIDSGAFFSVRSAGNTITLTVNSAHELFTDLPMPFETTLGGEVGYKDLCETLLFAWVLYEDGLLGRSAKRAAEDARLLWGRRVIEMLREQAT